MGSMIRFVSLMFAVNCRWESTTAVIMMDIALFIFGENAVHGQHVSLFTLIIVGLFGFFAQILACVLNDITDLEIDRINHPERPLPSGKINLSQAWFMMLTCLISSFVCGLILASSALSYICLFIHLIASMLYSFPHIRLSRHWFSGPLTIVTSFSSHLLFILSCTSLYYSEPIGKQIIFLMVGASAIHHLLTVTLKDVRDIKGDAIGGASSLAMRIPISALYHVAIIGYLVPWILLYFQLEFSMSSVGQFADIIVSLKILTLIFFGIGLVLSYFLLYHPEPLIHYRFSTIVRLMPLYLFQVGQPIMLNAVRSYKLSS